jgi:phenylacetate-CoA ligase
MIRPIKNIIDHRLRFNPYFKSKLKAVLDQKEWSYRQLKERQNALFLTVLNRAVSRSTFYRRFYAEHGVDLNQIKSVEDIHLLPIINKNHVRNHLKEFYVGNPWIKTTGHTSGSSGTPLFIYRDYQSTISEGAYLWAQRAMFGLHPGMKIVSLRGKLDRSEMRRFNSTENCLYLSSFNLRATKAKWYYEQLQQFQPYAILAYPSSVEILANFFIEKNLTLEIPYIFTSSEQVYPHQRAKVEKVFNTKIIDWYGNAERTIALEQRKDYQYYELPLYSVNEYQENRTITTGLISKSFPLIRYDVDDVIVPQVEKTSFQIKEIMGRHDDVLILPDGTRVGRIGAVFLDIEGVDFAQILQESPERFSLNLVVNDKFSGSSQEKIQSRFHKLAGDLQYDIAFVAEEDIIRTQAGKYKLVISKIKA